MTNVVDIPFRLPLGFGFVANVAAFNAYPSMPLIAAEFFFEQLPVGSIRYGHPCTQGVHLSPFLYHCLVHGSVISSFQEGSTCCGLGTHLVRGPPGHSERLLTLCNFGPASMPTFSFVARFCNDVGCGMTDGRLPVLQAQDGVVVEPSVVSQTQAA